MRSKFYSLLTCAILLITWARADNGHMLWLRKHDANPVKIICMKHSVILSIAVKELQENWTGPIGACIVLKVRADKQLKADGFKLNAKGIEATTELGVLYGVYEFLRRQQTGQQINGIANPSYQYRILNHWDNLNGTVERGYAGRSIFWRDKDLVVTEPDKKLWTEYARANASVGINGSVLNNVNASPLVLSPNVLARVKSIADVLRPYGIKTYLSINFSSPAKLGGLKTSDPLDPGVRKWWNAKVKEIYSLVPDFGGFVVKANSEGQPGPQDYGRSHADGANMLADILKPYSGIVMWRAFVYNASDNDRAKLAYKEFLPLDGKFKENVILQVKNGPIDFQPREPFSPLFGAMKKTAVTPEFQITQEYLGHSYQLVYLATMWEEILKSDTYQQGKGSTVARVTDASIYPQKYSAIAGVANIGLDTNWTGHPFAQANWYAFGRLAWDNKLSSGQIADEWLKLTFANAGVDQNQWKSNFLIPIKRMMLESYEAVVNYSMPLGLHHIFAEGEHYGPGPWWAPKNVRPDITPPYYHRADTNGIGFNRTTSGSNAVSEYHEPLASQFDSLTCPEMYLLWFHHVPWNYKTNSGRTLWDELCYRYDSGVKQVRGFQITWDNVKNYVDADHFNDVESRLRRQSRDAQVWKDACVLYFQQFSKRPIPDNLERPVYDLNFLEKVKPLSILN